MYDLYEPPPTRRSDYTTIALAATALVLIAAVVIWGAVRYGGIDGLVLRVRAEITARRPHPDLVPTPIAYDAAAAQQLAISAPTATLPPAVTPVAGSEDTAPTPTLAPTATPVAAGGGGAASGATPTPLALHAPAAPAVELTGLAHFWQTWNNCGPATLAMGLSFYGCALDQAEVGEALRTNREDKNVSPDELVAYARAQGLESIARANGNGDLLRTLLSNNMPVLIETWVEPEPGDGLGHYRLLTGYDDAAREWIAYDSFVSTGVDRNQPYRGIRIPYDEAARDWAVFNNVYVLIYTAPMEPLVQSILGGDYDEQAMWQRALRDAEHAVQQRPDDPFAWFNLGTDLVATGQLERAAAAYDHARAIGLPWRMLWYQFGPFAAYHGVGRYDELIALADATLALTTHVEELHYWRGMGLLARGDVEGARAAFRRALELNPGYAEAVDALATIERSAP
ncbi:MAG: tetratricopeptide repeat protein [Anaerolineae bacterium]|nr:tetratricopeptide repeat protein [Anaerolineae bacterium]